MSQPLLQALKRGPILLDAGMGTRLIGRGLGRSEASAWNLDRPDEILEIHHRDVLAGSQALLTNTFCAGRNWLERFGLGDQTREINRRGVELARIEAASVGWVLGSIGPTAQGDLAPLIEQAEALVEAGSDALILETHTFEQAEPATRALVDRFEIPVVASLIVWPEAMGEAARRLAGAGASSLGVNCLPTMARTIEIVRKLHQVSDLPLWVKPGITSGSPAINEVQSFRDAVPELLAHGVRLLGGCCGTTEAHVGALKAGLLAWELQKG